VTHALVLAGVPELHPQWIRHALELEEDVALANIALGLLGQARALRREIPAATW
jgi:1,2-phenylacetyl-CoA epoxidase catalytic subunit